MCAVFHLIAHIKYGNVTHERQIAWKMYTRKINERRIKISQQRENRYTRGV